MYPTDFWCLSYQRESPSLKDQDGDLLVHKVICFHRGPTRRDDSSCRYMYIQFVSFNSMWNQHVLVSLGQRKSLVSLSKACFSSQSHGTRITNHLDKKTFRRPYGAVFGGNHVHNGTPYAQPSSGLYGKSGNFRCSIFSDDLLVSEN